MSDREIVSTQIRIPNGLHEYIQKTSAEMGIPQNAVMIMLMWEGKKIREAPVSVNHFLKE